MMLFVVLVAALAQVNCQSYTTTTTYTTTEYVDEPKETYTTTTTWKDSTAPTSYTTQDYSQFDFKPSFAPQFSDISTILKDFEMPSAEDLKNMTPEEIKAKMAQLGDISKEIERTKKDVEERVRKFNAKNTVAVSEARRQVDQARDQWDMESAKSAMKRVQGEFEREDSWNRADIEKLKNMNIEGQLKGRVAAAVGGFAQPQAMFAQQAQSKQPGQAAFMGNWY